MRLIVSIFIVFLFVSCGYQPSSKFARNIVGDKVSTSVIISLRDPENSVIIKDSVDAAIIEVFHTSLVDKKDAKVHLVLSISNPSYSPIQYDENGYIVAYRTTIVLHIKKYFNGISKNYTARGTYDFNIAPNSVITDQERFQAIKEGAKKAIKSFLAQISAEGSK
ncbi:MAG: LPS assembly lipoprotein LptE [Campylobacterales bacterium]